MRKAIISFMILSLSIGLSNCTAKQSNNIATIAPLVQNYSTPTQKTKTEIKTASQVYMKTKDSALKWSNDAILINVHSSLGGYWNMYYYSKEKNMVFVYLDFENLYQEVKLNSVTDLPRFIKAPYQKIENWKIDSDKALALSGKDFYVDMFIEYNPNTKTMEWKIADFNSIYVDINTGTVRK